MPSSERGLRAVAGLDKVRRAAAEAAAGVSWIDMTIPDPETPDVVAGAVTRVVA